MDHINMELRFWCHMKQTLSVGKTKQFMHLVNNLHILKHLRKIDYQKIALND